MSHQNTMSTEKLSDCFNVNFKLLKVFALWPGRESTRWFKLYSVIFLIINLIIYNIFLTLNLVATPLTVDLWIREVIFYFTEVAVTAKACMIIFMRKKILEALNILDGEIFNDKDEESRKIMTEHISKYKTLWKAMEIWSNFCYSFQVFCPFLFLAIFPNKTFQLPVCKYYFLSDEVVSKYFAFWYFYQSAGIYGHMQYNVNIDTLIAGFILMAIVQVKILNRKLLNLKSELNDEKEVLTKFRRYLKHYQVLKQYCSTVQDMISITMFVQFSMASMIICVVLTGLTLPSTVETFMFMISYLGVMVMEIFLPAWLGTYLAYESEKLAFAVYSSEWIPRSEGYKSTLKLFLQQSMVQITFTGWRLFPLSLDTFVSIIKTAYSFFTLIRNVQDREVKPN